NLTTLSGDIGIENNISDNTYHVVVSVDDVGSAKIDGFTITKGNANGANSITINSRVFDRDCGGGINNRSSTPTITNTIISNNSANNGGGIYNSQSFQTLTNIIISGNSANNSGGGIYNNSSSPIITNTTISNNSAYNGGGGYNYASSPIITNTNISDNSADYGGGIYNIVSSPTLTNTTISDNSATTGGGIYNIVSSPTINNSIIWGNTKNSDQSVNNVYNINNSTPVYKYSLIQGSMVNSNWNSSFGTNGGNNIDVNPMFANPTNGDFTLTITSPAINAGSNTLYGASLSTATDLAGNPRLFGTTIDMGAYENQPVVISPTNNVLFVKQGATGTGDGSSWA
ncbi:choice-of-anchor Q domain-containing protein, partial [Paenimyroides tangerinum]|uniref:choice-of-anchor Q domain-containing protein n=1 Tax=Paenimyroides tangerinum TaxID=2488728 RepID=UPI0029393107